MRNGDSTVVACCDRLIGFNTHHVCLLPTNYRSIETQLVSVLDGSWAPSQNIKHVGNTTLRLT